MIFGRKNNGDGAGGDAGSRFSPEKAAAFFTHAATVHETGNYEYAIQSWLSGLKFDPQNLVALKGILASVGAFSASPAGKKGLSKETTRPIAGKTDVERFLSTLLEWAMSPNDSAAAVRATEQSMKLQLKEPTEFLAERALLLGSRDKKPRKDWFLKLSDAFSSVERFDRSIEAAQLALKLDPSDQALSNNIKNLSAQSAMKRGNYGVAGEGGYRQSVRDSDKQRMLDESERIVKTEDALERVLAEDRANYLSRPTDVPSIERYCRRLMERGTPADEQEAYDLYMKGFTESGQFRLRELAGQIKIRKKRRAVSEAKRAHEAKPTDPALAEAYTQAQNELRDIEIEEIRLGITNYPTNLQYKYELGRRLVDAKRFDDAIPVLQEAQNDPKYRGNVMNYLGKAFLEIEYAGEAVEMFRKGLEMREITDELNLELHYGLMRALQAKAEADRDLGSAQEADSVASSITVKQFNYRDVRQRRDAIKKLIAELRAGPGM